MRFAMDGVPLELVVQLTHMDMSDRKREHFAAALAVARTLTNHLSTCPSSHFEPKGVTLFAKLRVTNGAFKLTTLPAQVP